MYRGWTTLLIYLQNQTGQNNGLRCSESIIEPNPGRYLTGVTSKTHLLNANANVFEFRSTAGVPPPFWNESVPVYDQFSQIREFRISFPSWYWMYPSSPSCCMLVNDNREPKSWSFVCFGSAWSLRQLGWLFQNSCAWHIDGWHIVPSFFRSRNMPVPQPREK